MKKKCSILIPTRGRGSLLCGSMESMVSLAVGAMDLEFLLWVDEDDTTTKSALEEYAKRCTAPITIIIAPRQPNLSYPLLIPMKKNIPQSKNLILLGLDNLCNSIRTAEPLLCSGDNGYSSLEIIVSLLISTKSKSRINLPINTKMYKINSK